MFRELRPPVAEALGREGLPECMGEDDARSLAGVFVDMLRQQHAQRRVLVQKGAQQLWKEADQLTDCCRCKRLSYITVAIDNQVSLVSLPSSQPHQSTHCTERFP